MAMEGRIFLEFRRSMEDNERDKLSSSLSSL